MQCPNCGEKLCHICISNKVCQGKGCRKPLSQETIEAWRAEQYEKES